ncbi:MAG: hypothetical protein NZM06_04010 [Chloroherpetonaceae bacterium]|nr:hypothetical protein [Chloroherpetonaceae bacterium]MDW8438572.1 hypothetical protein [Chloroherpetonaceae bacterium]
MPDEKSLVGDSLRQLRALELAQDSTLYVGRSAVSVWLEKALSPELRLPFFESLLLLVGGLICAYLLYLRAKRAKRNDQLQGRALQMAAFALLALATKGLFFIVATLTLANALPAHLYGQLYWLGWQLSLVWFVFFGLLFALGFVRDRKSYDVYFITTLILLAAVLSLTYNDWTWRQILWFAAGTARYDIKAKMPFSFGEEHLWLRHSKNTYYAMMIHFGAWIAAFGAAGYRVYRRSKAYQDESARNASHQLALALFFIAGIGIAFIALLYASPKTLFAISLSAAILALASLFYGVRGIYRHGRYRRV